MNQIDYPLENLILDIVKRRQKVSEKELLEDLRNLGIKCSVKELYKALMNLELFEKIIVLSQKDIKIIMIKL